VFTYNKVFSKLEKKWQNFWEENKLFKAANPGEPGSEKPKYYCLDMFPYPSGAGLHVGHPEGYTATDIVCRYKRMKGYNVLHTMGWDAFGLPAEQYAIKTGVSPKESIKVNSANFKKQLKAIGLSFDWEREISTCDPSFYKWTQFIFLKLYSKGLAYQKKGLVNWCPELRTVLANDEVIDGKSERGGHLVERKLMRQWYLKITDYADDLLNGLTNLDWPKSTKEHQKNWIGRSIGANINFLISNSDKKITTFTTRADTLMGVTFIVLAPEHPLVDEVLVDEYRSSVEQYRLLSSKKSDLQRTDLNKDKSGVFTGGYAIHPLTKKEIPIWVADYVLYSYGTGAIMAVPGHDERDLEFANKYSLAVLNVLDDKNNVINSSWDDDSIDGLSSSLATKKVIETLSVNGSAEKKIQYKLRDWTFSRQRYWGEPIPIRMNSEGVETPLMEDELPLVLPDINNYQPSDSGLSPLARVKEWVSDHPNGILETHTMPGSAGSSWYWLRYMDPSNESEPFSSASEKYWGQVDLYIGGSEHSVGHLLYSRFWNRFLYKLGMVSHEEPFKKVVHQGMILGEDGEKMSKSRGNVINPDDIIYEFGADTLRLYEMFMGPLEKTKPWKTSGINGVNSFLNKVWSLLIDFESGIIKSNVLKDFPEKSWDDKFVTTYNNSIKIITNDIENLKFNTAISQLMILRNEAQKFYNNHQYLPRSFTKNFIKLLFPFSPHICEEIWSMAKFNDLLSYSSWPSFDDSKTKSSNFELPIQVNGKLRDKITIENSLTEEEIKKLVLKSEKLKKWLSDKELKKFIYVKNRLVNIVVV